MSGAAIVAGIVALGLGVVVGLVLLAVIPRDGDDWGGPTS